MAGTPVEGLTESTRTSLEPWLATKSQRPLGSRVKLRGVFPPVLVKPTSFMSPVAPSEYCTMLSSPRLEPYRNEPDNTTSAPVFITVEPEGTVESDCKKVRRPEASRV